MLVNMLEILRCPFCGSTLTLERVEALESHGEEVKYGIIFCQCSAYPIVAGIPVFTADRTADKAREDLINGAYEQALFTMLGLDEEDRRAAFRRFVEKGSESSFREGVEIFCPTAEGAYIVNRFSDPTYLAGQALLRAVGRDSRCFTKRAIDLCGGTGHLTRVMCQMAGGAEVLLADAYYWKLWLAKRFTSPTCHPICCDANNPLPLACNTLSLAVCTDAFHYIWSKRLFAREIMRTVGQKGIIVLSHLHNALVENFSAGMPLAPQWWRNQFVELKPRLFKESDLFESAITQREVNLSHKYSDEELRDEAAMFLIATKLDGFYQVYEQPNATAISGVLAINPLYQIVRKDGADILQLQFPSAEYEEEFGACKRYLPDQIEINAGTLNDLSEMSLNYELERLIESRVLLDLPERY